MDANLDGLVLDGSVGVGDVLEGDAVELAFVDVGDAVILPALRRADRTLQIVAETVLAIPAFVFQLFLMVSTEQWIMINTQTITVWVFEFYRVRSGGCSRATAASGTTGCRTASRRRWISSARRR